jgi:signal transduction histidine kinase
MKVDFSDLDLTIARTRIVLSLTGVLSLYVDPTAGAPFALETPLLVTLAAHLAFSLGIHRLLRVESGLSARLVLFASVMDVLFATVIAILTEGPTTPAHLFFAFAIIAVACRAGFRAALLLTAYGVLLYVPLILLCTPAERSAYVMRPVYLAVIGYLFSFLGQQRLDFETRLRRVETTAQRHDIARSLHDGYLQALASVNLRLKTTRVLLERGDAASALTELIHLERGVGREYDDVRAYVRSLVEIEEEGPSTPLAPSADTVVRVAADFSAQGPVADHVLQIMLEGMRNARKHGGAATAIIEARGVDDRIEIRIDDDGVGFVDPSKAPWSIASRVDHVGGRLRIARDDRPGGHLEIELPATG